MDDCLTGADTVSGSEILYSRKGMSVMLMTAEEFTKKYRDIFFDFDFSQNLEVEYENDIYKLADHSQMLQLRDRSMERGDYQICKNANNVLAVYETRMQFVRYSHFPVLMHIELSSFCNCECIMCRHCYEKNSAAKVISRDKLAELEAYFPSCKFIMLNGYGEPFIYPHIRELLTIFEKYQVKIITTTNLQHLPEGLLPQINQVFYRLNVSCDGASQHTYESIRRHSSFDRFLQNAKLLRKQCPDVQLFLSAVAMRQNIEEAPALVELAKQLGFEEIRFGRLGSNLFLGNEKDELIYFPNFASKMLGEAKRIGTMTGVRVIVPMILKDAKINEEAAQLEAQSIHKEPFYHDEDYYDRLHARYLELKENGEFQHLSYSVEGTISCKGICHWIGYGFFVNSSEKVRPCVEIPYNRIQEEEEEEVLDHNHEELLAFRKHFIEGKVPAACMDCAFIMSDEVGSLKVDLEEYKHYFAEKAEQTREA